MYGHTPGHTWMNGWIDMGTLHVHYMYIYALLPMLYIFCHFERKPISVGISTSTCSKLNPIHYHTWEWWVPGISWIWNGLIQIAIELGWQFDVWKRETSKGPLELWTLDMHPWSSSSNLVHVHSTRLNNSGESYLEGQAPLQHVGLT